MPMITQLSTNDRAVITFKGSMLVGSDVRMTHWLYLWLSMLDAVVNVRSTYVALQLATSLLVQRVTLESFVYLLGTITKLTRLMCITQTLLRFVVKLVARAVRSVRLIRSLTRERIEWSADGASLFLRYRVYYLLLCLIVLVLLHVRGSPSFMVRATPYRVGAYGGGVEITHIWGSELACDLISLLGMLTLLDAAAPAALHRVGVGRLLAATMLGLDPSDPEFLVDGSAFTKCSLGSLLQVLYLSGPSAWVRLAGDYVFHDGGLTKEPVRFVFTLLRATATGFVCSAQGSSVTASGPPTTADLTRAPSSSVKVRAPGDGASVKQSLFERHFRVVSDGYAGQLLFVDNVEPGKITVNKETGQREYSVLDALATMSILDIKYLLGNYKKIRVG